MVVRRTWQVPSNATREQQGMYEIDIARYLNKIELRLSSFSRRYEHLLVNLWSIVESRGGSGSGGVQLPLNVL